MMTRFFTTAATLIALAVPATAQSTFERMEDVAEQMNAMMNEAFIAEIPALEGNMPDPEFDDTLRAAYRCMYDEFVARAGEDAVSQMVDDMEAALETATPQQFMEGGVNIENPEGLNDEDSAAIATECGMMEAFMTRMAESGAMTIMMQQQ